jgi:F-type H+-transporting ATPase subunit a
MLAPQLLLAPAADIKPGDHTTGHFLGLTWNIDTMYTTVLAAAITIAMFWYVTRGASARTPGKPQLIFEGIVTQVRSYAAQALGHDVPAWVVSLGVTLFSFILICNWMAWVPSGHDPERLGPPTADVNLTYALAFTVAVLYTYLGVKRKGAGGYFGGWFTVKPPIRVPIILLEQIINPLSLALRLFGNIFAGGIMLAVIALLPFKLFLFYGAANIAWKLFDSGFIAPIQAFIFSFLTILYLGMASAEEH